MALQAATGLKSPAPSTMLRQPGSQAGLRGPSDRYALRSAFFAPSIHLLLPPTRQAALATAPRFSMRVTSKQAYICRDCGYIYNDRTPFEKQPDKFFCPVCGAPKRRFRPYEPVIEESIQCDNSRLSNSTKGSTASRC